jgi:hypothetical protein
MSGGGFFSNTRGMAMIVLEVLPITANPADSAKKA